MENTALHLESLVTYVADNLCGVASYIKNLLRSLKEVFQDERLVKVKRIMVSRFNVVNTFLAIALFKSLREELRGLSAIKSPTLNEVEGSFEEIYNALGLQLNTALLSKEISDLRKVAEYLRDGEKLLYAEVLSRLGNRPGRPQDPKRNFFAHAELTYEETLVRRG